MTHSLRIRTLALLLPLLAACGGAGGVLAGKADWSTLVTGQGTVETRVVNESSEPITVRVQDEQDRVVAQAPLGPHGAETVNLPPGSMHVTVRVERDGHASFSDPQNFTVSAKGKPAEWKFTPPSIE